MIEKSTFAWRGPRRTLRPTLPISVPDAPATAVPFELGITFPAGTTGRTKAKGLKKYAIQPDGKILAVLSSADLDDNCDLDGLLVRYNPDGSLDTSFGKGGSVFTEYQLASVTVQPADGKIVAHRFIAALIARFNPDGSPDAGFGSGGTVTNFGAGFLYSIAIDSAGKIVAAGEIGHFALFRFNVAGSPDSSFDGDGIVTMPSLRSATSVVIQPDGKIVAAGYRDGPNSSDFALARYNVNGSLDNTFGGGDGITTIDFNSSADFAHEVVLDRQGRAVVVGGSKAGGSDQVFAIARVVGDPIQTPICTNPIDCADFFVREQYLDFLGREPDTTGFQNWVNTLGNCPNGGYGEFDNPHCDRVHVSAGFYQSEEFQARGFWAYRFYEVALDRRPTFAEFIPDMLRVGGPQSPQSEATSKAAYTNDFVLKQEFRNRYDGLSNAAYLNALEQNAEVTLANKQALLDALNAGTKTRALVLREVVEDQLVFNRFFNRGFVSMQYFGYLRRDLDAVGFQNWVNTLDAAPHNFRHMIFGFIYSTEYRQRFGQP